MVSVPEKEIQTPLPPFFFLNNFFWFFFNLKENLLMDKLTCIDKKLMFLYSFQCHTFCSALRTIEQKSNFEKNNFLKDLEQF